jgi:hypothetical protein
VWPLAYHLDIFLILMVKLRNLVAAVPESQGHSLLTQGFASVGRSCLVYGQCLAILVGHSRLDILTSEIIFTAILFYIWFFLSVILLIVVQAFV